jgi:16S rRNA (guanine527-N7)-methyltransferase
MQPEEFQKQFDVSRESFVKIKQYQALLVKWQKAINLVGPKTLDDAWARHFADSAQLLPKIDNNIRCLYDLGTGAGFPGLVLAILRPKIDVHLVESDERKAQFLRTVSRETSRSVAIHNERIEDLAGGPVPDMVTARALAPLFELLTYMKPWAVRNPGLEGLFLKGKNAADEVEQARIGFDFDCESTYSLTDKDAQILHLKNIRPKA